MYYASEALHPLTLDSKETALPTRPSWTTEEAYILAKMAKPRGVVRSNSCHAVHHLKKFTGGKSNSKFHSSIEKDKMQKANDRLLRVLEKSLPYGARRFDEVITTGPVSSGVFSNIDMSKTWFSLQDVMELSILHMQQMNEMQQGYEQRIKTLTALNAQHHVLRDRVPSFDQESLVENEFEYVDDCEVFEGPKMDTKRPKTRKRIKMKRKMRQISQIKTPAFNLSFFDRLQHQTNLRMNHMRKMKERLKAEEFAQNEQKAKLARSHQSANHQKFSTFLPANFMPVPSSKSVIAGFPVRPAPKCRRS
ncbi:hypothetical protein BKA69DRAFT_1073859 [Paraphysoderma sedebokerense]|nr:hypothetical protein BKA69DRAFT_1073859 [Paraphysoderma sedebokerense]